MTLHDARRVLVCLRYGIGDLVMQLPALSALRDALPEAHITALGARPAIELMEGDGRIDELVSVHDFGFSHWGDFGDDRRRARVGEWLRQRQFDVIIDPSHAVMGFGQAIWQSSAAKQLLDTDHEIDRTVLAGGGSGLEAIRASVRKGWGIEMSETSTPRLPLGEQEKRYVDQLLNGLGWCGQALYAISPVASSALKCWPLERAAAVGRHLVDSESAARLLLIAGDQEAVGRQLERAIDRPGRTVRIPPMDLRRTGALLARCRAMLCNDTGLMHLAAAVDIPVVAVFGPTSPAIYAPPGATVFFGETACPHRLEKRFGPPRCVVEGHCLLEGRRSCIDAIDADPVANAMTRVTQSERD